MSGIKKVSGHFQETEMKTQNAAMKQIGTWLTRFGFRFANRGDLVPGKEMWRLDLEHFDGVDMTVSPADRAIKIQLDNPAVRSRRTVYYHRVNPYWEGQCFLSAEEFL